MSEQLLSDNIHDDNNSYSTREGEELGTPPPLSEPLMSSIINSEQ